MAKPVKIVRAVVRYENSDDNNRDFDISLDVHVEEDGTVGNMENGIVRKGEQCVAIFSTWDDNKTTTPTTSRKTSKLPSRRLSTPFAPT